MNKGEFVKKTFSPSLSIEAIVGKAEEKFDQEVEEKKDKLDVYSECHPKMTAT